MLSTVAINVNKVRASLAGHYWSLAPLASWLLHPQPLPPSQPFSTYVHDNKLGPLRLTGALRRAGSHTLLLALHGLGGDISSHYIERSAIAAHAHGIDCLRLNMRGAALQGEDFYHAGLTDDIHAALTDPLVANYRHILLMGFSLGGHLVLRYATEAHRDRRVRAVAAICPPIDLAAGASDIDAAIRWPYRRYVLASLREMLRRIAARRRLPLPLAQALKITRIRDWDEHLVAPRFGFAGANDYYQRMGVGPRLKQLTVPTLMVLAKHDPMVLTRTVTNALRDPPPALQLHIVERAGHVGSPSDADLQQPGPLGMEMQAVSWFRQHAASAAD